jgi:hypothetical protein
MKINNLQIFGAVIASAVMIFTAGFYANDTINNNNQSAQLLRFRNTANQVKTQVAPVRQASTPTSSIKTLTSTEAISANPFWRKITSNTGVVYTEIPQTSFQAVINFCKELDAVSPDIGANKMAARMSDGRFYCINTNGNVGSVCGNGTQGSCVSSGCCGSCLGGLPDGVTDITQLPNIVFIPESIIKVIKQATN